MRYTVDAAPETKKHAPMHQNEKPTPLGLNSRNWPWYLLAFVAAIVVAGLADVSLSRVGQDIPEPLAGFFHAVTDFGLSEYVLVPALVVLIASALALAFVRRRLPRLALLELTQLSGFVFAAVGLAGLCSNLLKRAIGRARPPLFDEVGAFHFGPFTNSWTYESFPSGHTATIFAVAIVVLFLRPRWFPVALTLAILVGISRVTVGMHYPTDVLGGVVCGVLMAYAIRAVFARLGWMFKRRPDGTIRRRGLGAIRRLWRRVGRAQRAAR